MSKMLFLSASAGGRDRDQSLQNPVVYLWRVADPWSNPLNWVMNQYLC